jgi:hypothetical protein
LPATACSITSVTLFGCDNITTWLEETTVVTAFICFAMLFSCSGAIILSWLATMYQVGFSCHAAEVGFALKIENGDHGAPGERHQSAIFGDAF